MKPSRHDASFYHARRAERAGRAWLERLARATSPAFHRGGRTAADCLNDAINERAGIKRAIGAGTWPGALSLLALVRSNQERRRPAPGRIAFAARDPYTGAPEPATLAGYMLRSLAQRGAGYSERRPYWRRILSRMPRDVLAAGIIDCNRRA